MATRWNHNIEYHTVIGAALRDLDRPEVLDVGCGEGTLCADLAAMAASVTGIDLDDASIGRARAEVRHANVSFLTGDFMVHPFQPESFDGVVSVAALHHMDERAALERMAQLLRPGGVLAVVGLARARLPRDLPWELAGAVTTRTLKRRHGGYWETDAPKIWPPPSSYGQIRALAEELLPGCRFRRHVLWRYSVVWRRPVTA